MEEFGEEAIAKDNCLTMPLDQFVPVNYYDGVTLFLSDYLVNERMPDVSFRIQSKHKTVMLPSGISTSFESSSPIRARQAAPGPCALAPSFEPVCRKK